MDEKAGDELIRLQVFLSRSGVGSRRTCESYITDGRISVNGLKITKLGSKVSYSDEIAVDGKILNIEKRKVYIAVNKPKGYLCTNYDPFGRPIVSDLFGNDLKERLFHVGRLDYMSRGLMLITSDGHFANRMSHPSNNIAREYLVQTRKPVDGKRLKNISNGVIINKVKYRPFSFKFVTKTKVKMYLTEGKKREIRIIFRYLNNQVTDLLRIRIGSISIDGLREGSYKKINRDLIREILFG